MSGGADVVGQGGAVRAIGAGLRAFGGALPALLLAGAAFATDAQPGAPAGDAGPGASGQVVPEAGPGGADTAGVAGHAVVVVDLDEVFARSRVGREVLGLLQERRRRLVAENQQIEEQLLAEEKALTERRASVEPAEFRRLAEAFDLKVEAIRRAQDAKASALAKDFERARSGFLDRIRPQLAAVMRDVGADIVLERGNVIMHAPGVDVTDLVIEAVDRAGAGAAGSADD